MAKVGIVMRTRDRPATLARALHSVQAQGFGDWRIALVNDGGDGAALEAYVDREAPGIRERLEITHHAEPRGRWAAAKAGVRALDCAYLVLLDDDDSWSPRFLETAASALDAAGPGIGGVCCRVVEIFETIGNGAIVTRRQTPYNPELTAIGIANMAQYNLIVPNSFLYRSTLHDELGLYDETLPVLGDWDFYLRVIRHHDIRLLEEALAFWHKRLAAGPDSYANSVTGGVKLHHETAARREAVSRPAPGAIAGRQPARPRISRFSSPAASRRPTRRERRSWATARGRLAAAGSTMRISAKLRTGLPLSRAISAACSGSLSTNSRVTGSDA
ncbi:glycosyltransferase family 2 protein [Paralimibaculum aggregatum]|uniref:glycosyltransferase family 2 protein n=1 Tax=Paralimibaculum aggregatum TaxID=3036245 RepID=UPI003324242A